MTRPLTLIVFVCVGVPLGITTVRSLIPPDAPPFAAAFVYYATPLAMMLALLMAVLMAAWFFSDRPE
ncbi:hypothetical protein [Kozakia baliensis]|uniref:hypothetical protein n=1 Tax=Kozakia baliensis TaxID=153496 RepID=UPI00087D16BC|nr:hypothetical protein [Kozakia baliensis]AOX21653.1 hypothetical protein A0U90_14215 [Kozakia baliensis]